MNVSETMINQFPGASTGTTHDGWPTVTVEPAQWHEACLWLKEQAGMNFLASLTAVHFIDDGNMQVVAHMYSIGDGDPIADRRMSLHTSLPPEIGAELASVADVWTTAEWHEREAYDMFGIRFSGNPDLRRILMDVSFEDYPLRKDFKDRKPNLGVTQETLQKDAASNR